MSVAILALDDASFLDLHLDWSKGELRVLIVGGASPPGQRTLLFRQVRFLSVEGEAPWGPSVSILELTKPSESEWPFQMQSGDTIRVRASSAEIVPEMVHSDPKSTT